MKERNLDMAKSGSFSQPFNMGYAPPKEGRVPPAGIRIQRRRRATLIFILAIVGVLCLVMKYVQTSNVTARETKLGDRLKGEYGSLKEVVKDGQQVPLAGEITTPTPTPLENVASTSGAASKATKAASPPPKAKEEEYKPTKEDEEFDQLLMDIIDLLPTEMHQRALLAPITSSGAERMNEVGLRTREFKALFEAWEELHLVFHDKTVVIQDDVISYLRKRDHSIKARSTGRKGGNEEPLDLAMTIRSYENFRYLLQKLGDVLFPWVRPYFGDHMTLHAQLYSGGRGIVFTAGTDQAPFVMTGIGVLRALGCNLPIEVMYLGEGDLDVDARERLEDMPGVVTRDIRLMVKDDGWQLAGWAGKPFAILFSSFREVIFIDADALFLTDPTILFEDKSYTDTGALFFHDRLMKGEGKRHWMETVLPRPVSRKARKSRMWGTSDHMQESGVIVVDTFKHFIPLLVASRMNGPDRDGNADAGITGVYDMLFGDKETFWLSWEMVGSQNYAFHSGPAGVIGNFVPADPAAKEKPIDPVTGLETVVENEVQKEVDTPFTSTITTGEVTRTRKIWTDNATICAPQLLHISREGNPLWFNGWILSNKFDKERSPIAQLEMFMKEPTEYQDPESWTIGESNNCCLRNTETFEFTEQEKLAIGTILRTAFQVGAVGRTGGGPRRGGDHLYG